MAFPPPSARPTAAFVGASRAAPVLGLVTFSVGLWNATLATSEQGFCAAVLRTGPVAAVSLQKSVRDRSDGLPVTTLYPGLSWSAPESHRPDRLTGPGTGLSG